MAKLNTYVTVHRSEDGTSHTFGPADDLPGWAEKAITNPDVWDGTPPAHVGARDGGTSGADAGDKPPAGNASRDAWVEYARTRGAPAEELADEADGGLGRNELREKYGS